MAYAGDEPRGQSPARDSKVDGFTIILVGLALLASCAGTPDVRETREGPPRAEAGEPSPQAAETRGRDGKTTPAAAKPSAAPAAKASPAPARICFAGDVLLDRGIRTRIGRGVDLLKDTESALRESDVFFFNLETAVGNAGTKVAKEFNFLGDPEFLSLLVKAKRTVAGLANNHVMDYGYEGLERTIAALDERGILHAGAGKNAAEASRPAVLTVCGRKFAFLSFGVTHPEAYYAGEKTPGIAGLEKERILLRLAEAKKEGAFTVVSLHWGMEYEDRQDAWQQDLARLLVDSGADCVFGHHPHVLQGIEVYKDRPIFYSVGNFIFDQWEDVKTRYRLIVGLEVSEKGNRIAFAPLLSSNTDFIPESPGAKDFDGMIALLRSVSPDPAAIDPAKAYEKHGLRWVPLSCYGEGKKP